MPLIGVAPENEITYPKINPTQRKETELTNGHTHFILTGDDNTKFNWGDEVKLKTELALRIAQGRSKYAKAPTCKIITIVIGENPACVKDIEEAKNNCWPVIFLGGSLMCEDVIKSKGGFPPEEEKKAEGAEGEAPQDAPPPAQPEDPNQPQADGKIDDPALKSFVDEGKFFICKPNSEDIANIAHLALTVTLLDLTPPAQNDAPGGDQAEQPPPA